MSLKPKDPEASFLDSGAALPVLSQAASVQEDLAAEEGSDKRKAGGDNAPPKKRKVEPQVDLPIALPEEELPERRKPHHNVLELPPLPFRVTAGLVILNWGTLENCGPGFFSHGNWFPVGFQSRRKTVDQRIGPKTWICEIENREGHPYFLVRNEEVPDEVYTGDTSSGVWRQVLGRTCAGPFMYGLSVDSVKEHIQRMAESYGGARPLNLSHAVSLAIPDGMDDVKPVPLDTPRRLKKNFVEQAQFTDRIQQLSRQIIDGDALNSAEIRRLEIIMTGLSAQISAIAESLRK